MFLKLFKGFSTFPDIIMMCKKNAWVHFLCNYENICLWIECSKQQLKFIQIINKGFDNTELIVEHNSWPYQPKCQIK